MCQTLSSLRIIAESQSKGSKKKGKRIIKRDNDNVNDKDKKGLESPMTMKRAQTWPRDRGTGEAGRL